MDIIKFAATAGLSYDPHENKYWDKQALRQEIDRTFELCHSCRMCFKFCDTFPAIFDLIDEQNLEVRNFSDKQIDAVAEKCFQCKICYFKCPYTKDDNHAFNLDFPRLMMRHQVIKAKERGITIRDKMLGNPDLLGKIGCITSGIANWANQLSLNRTLMQATMGIHRDKKLPTFASQTFESWFAKNSSRYQVADSEAIDKVVLFYTCFGNYNDPDIARDALFVLYMNKIQVAVPKLNCCGMPAMESGNLDLAIQEAEKNFKQLLPYIEKGYKVLVINPTCSLTMKDEYPILLRKKYSKEQLQQFRAGIFDTNEYLFLLKREDKFNRQFITTPGKIAYHIPCHYRAQNIGYRSRDMMKTIGQTEFVLVDECCGHNGTWAMKKENYQDSMRIGAKAFDKIKAHPHDIIASDCPLAAIQLKDGTGEDVLHTISVLARAYQKEGFPKKLPEAEEK